MTAVVVEGILGSAAGVVAVAAAVVVAGIPGFVDTCLVVPAGSPCPVAGTHTTLSMDCTVVAAVAGEMVSYNPPPLVQNILLLVVVVVVV